MGSTFAKIVVGFVTFAAVSYIGNKVVNGKRNEESKQILQKLMES